MTRLRLIRTVVPGPLGYNKMDQPDIGELSAELSLAYSGRDDRSHRTFCSEASSKKMVEAFPDRICQATMRILRFIAWAPSSRGCGIPQRIPFMGVNEAISNCRGAPKAPGEIRLPMSAVG
jgi:hypothetical protein